jgi:pSer/pThr/pTyr-binding forkhead associated (FHA) protein
MARGSSSLPKRSLLIGRSSACDVVIDHPEVSGRHAILSITQEGLYEIQDIGSKNGVYVNGERVIKKVLREGDKVALGSYELDWLSILKNPPAPMGGSDSPTRLTRASFQGKNVLRTIGWVILAVVVVFLILWFVVRPFIPGLAE